jgi:hypothetical protein
MIKPVAIMGEERATWLRALGCVGDRCENALKFLWLMTDTR